MSSAQLPLPTCHSHWSLQLTTHLCPLPIVHCPAATANLPLPTGHSYWSLQLATGQFLWPLPNFTAQWLLPTRHCPLVTAHWSLPLPTYIATIQNGAFLVAKSNSIRGFVHGSVSRSVGPSVGPSVGLSVTRFSKIANLSKFK